MTTEDKKAEEILKKRRLAAKGIKERRDGKAVDPMEDIGKFGVDKDPEDPDSPEGKQADIAARAAPVAIGLRR